MKPSKILKKTPTTIILSRNISCEGLDRWFEPTMPWWKSDSFNSGIWFTWSCYVSPTSKSVHFVVILQTSLTLCIHVIFFNHLSVPFLSLFIIINKKIILPNFTNFHLFNISRHLGRKEWKFMQKTLHNLYSKRDVILLFGWKISI